MDIVSTVLHAEKPSDLFGSADQEHAKPLYQRLARNVHPDQRPDDPRAGDAFANLQKMWTMLSPATAAAALELVTRRHTYTLGALVARGDIANVYAATYDDDAHTCVVKMARSPQNADLMAAEAKAVKKLSEVGDRFQVYFPEIIDHFRHADAENKHRTASVFTSLDGFYTLREVAEAYPSGICGEDVAWIFRRLLIAVDQANGAGIVHGSVVPENVMIHPGLHGLVLVDWVYSVETGSPLKAVASDYIDWIGGHARTNATHEHDVRFAAKTMLTILSKTDRHYNKFRAFFNGCTISGVPTAGELWREFDELIHDIYGARRFHAFSMPQRRDT